MRINGISMIKRMTKDFSFPIRCICIVFFCISCLKILNGQHRPGFLPEDIESNRLRIKCLCQPGVENKSPGRGLELSYQWAFGGNVENDEDPPFEPPLSDLETLENLIVKLKIPLVNQEGFKLLLGGFYRPETYHFNRIGQDYNSIFEYLNDRRLKNSGLDLIGVKSWNEKHYTVFRFKNSYNGDYNGFIDFNHQYAIYNFSAIYGIKKNDDFEYGFGINMTSSFRNNLVLPFFIYNRNFGNKWGVESVLPAMVLFRYNANPTTIFLSGFRYNSRSFSITVPDDQLYNFNHSELRFIVALERKMQDWIWLNLELGFQENFSTDFELDGNSDGDFQVEVADGPYLKLGLFLSPPKMGK